LENFVLDGMGFKIDGDNDIQNFAHAKGSVGCVAFAAWPWYVDENLTKQTFKDWDTRICKKKY
jgi:hypothetical protein